jgi:hypothetical protein
MPSKQKEQKSEVITINKTSLNIDNFDTLDKTNLTSEEQRELLMKTYELLKQCFIRV